LIFLQYFVGCCTFAGRGYAGV